MKYSKIISYHWRYSNRGKPFLIGILFGKIEIPILIGYLRLKIDNLIFRAGKNV